MSKIDEYLKATGLTKSQIADLSAEDSEVDVKALNKELQEKTRTGIREALKNDAGFVGEIKDEAIKSFEGQFYGRMHGAFKRAGLTKEEIDAAEGNNSKLLELAVERNRESSNDDVTKLQGELMESKKENEHLKEVEIPKIKAEEKNRSNSIIIDMRAKEHYYGLNAADLVGESLHPAFYTASMVSLKEKYDLRLEDGSIQVYQKGSELKAQNKEGTAVANFSDLFHNELETSNFIKKSNGTGEAAPAVNGSAGTTATTGEGVINPRMAEVLKNGGAAADSLRASIATD